MAENENQLLLDYCKPKVLFTCKSNKTYTEPAQHEHEHLEIIFVLSGAGQYEINDRTIDIKEGDLLVLNPGDKHRFILVEDDILPPTIFVIGCTDFKLKNYPVNYIPILTTPNIIHTTGDLQQKFYKICVSMAFEQEEWNVGQYHMLKSYLIQMLMYIIRTQSKSVAAPIHAYAIESINKKHIVEQIIGYFEEHYNEKISLDHVAENVYLSTFYISKIFKNETGEAPIHHLIRIRLEKAKELFDSNPDYSIQEVAHLVGYDDAYHFSRLFKKTYGITPTTYKKGEHI